MITWLDICPDTTVAELGEDSGENKAGRITALTPAHIWLTYESLNVTVKPAPLLGKINREREKKHQDNLYPHVGNPHVYGLFPLPRVNPLLMPGVGEGEGGCTSCFQSLSGTFLGKMEPIKILQKRGLATFVLTVRSVEPLWAACLLRSSTCYQLEPYRWENTAAAMEKYSLYSYSTRSQRELYSCTHCLFFCFFVLLFSITTAGVSSHEADYI